MIDGCAISVPIVIERPVEPVLARLGRTEDIRFSPSNRRLAIAGFGKSTCLLLDLEIDRTAASATLRIKDYLQIESAALLGSPSATTTPTPSSFSTIARLSAAVGTLHGVSYPHGLRFTPDGRRPFVADAGSPHVVAYDAADGDWSGERNKSLSLVVMSQETFLKGRNNPQEGGPKGLDIDASGQLLVVTCEEQAIACFDIARLPSEDAPGRLPSGSGPEVLRPTHAADNPLNTAAATAVASPPSQ